MITTTGRGALAGPLSPAVRRAALTALALLVVPAAPEALPYIPTTILLPGSAGAASTSQNSGGVAYVFSPSGASSVDLLAVDVSARLQGSSLATSTLTSPLPFVDRSSTTSSFAASLLANGSILVYAGDCSSDTDFAVWSYTPPNASTTATAGTWLKHAAALEAGAEGLSIGPSFLGGSLSFTSTLAPTTSSPIIYSYGGMCPWADQNASAWQGSATYSNQMVKLTPSEEPSGTTYSIGPLPSNGPPIAEAGFTFTPLSPSMTNRSGTVTQQFSSVLLGGHTQYAFINMSTAALWSLPEETWSFITIGDPAAADTELARSERRGAGRSLPSTVESRSGHSAVLNEDGSALVVLGGWVGDITQAASPQLAVLEMGGNLADWQWSIPAAQPSGAGIFGHGAALLPGNVMMVYGGYNISASSSQRRRRDAAAGGATQMFLNLTSMTWSDDYANPSLTSASGGSRSGSASGTTSSKGRRIGLGVGLGLGLAGLGAMLFLAYWLFRRHRQRRVSREETVRALAQDATHFFHGGGDGNGGEMAERNHGAWDRAPWYTGGPDPYMRGQDHSLGYESLRGARQAPSFYSSAADLGAQGYPPLTGSVARKPAPKVARGLYQPTNIISPYDSRMGQGNAPGGIHPIYEDDEEDITSYYTGAGGPETPTEAAADPFMTPSPTRNAAGFTLPPPSRPSRSPSPETKRTQRGHDHEVQEWMSDLDKLSTRIQQQPHHNAGGTAGARRSGRGSPSRRPSQRGVQGGGGAEEEARTDSSLSESARSAFSLLQGAASRSGSVHSHRPSNSLGGASQHNTAAAPAADGRLGSSGGNSSNSSHTYTTAKSIPALQAEGPGLLMGGGGGGRGRYDGDPGGAGDPAEEDLIPGSPSKSKPRRTWIGSLKRVFSGAGAGGGPNYAGASSSSSATPPSSSGRDSARGKDPEPRVPGLDNLGSALLQRRRHGREAWEAGPAAGGDAAPSAGGGAATAAEGDDDWDIERAVEQRLVQVMFTVPKERLRVVNAEVEEEDAASLGAAGGAPAEYYRYPDHADYETERAAGAGAGAGAGGSGGGYRRSPSPGPAGSNTGAGDEGAPRTPAALARTEAARLERPRSRVLLMVEELEGRGGGSRSGSPA